MVCWIEEEKSEGQLRGSWSSSLSAKVQKSKRREESNDSSEKEWRTHSLVRQSTARRERKDRIVSVSDGVDVVERPRVGVDRENVAMHLPEATKRK